MDNRIESIRENAQLVIGQLGPLSDVTLGLNRDSVAWVEGFIERTRANPDFDVDNVEGLVGVIGSFLGESIIASAGGQWYWSDEHQDWSVSFAADTQAFPFVKVRKLFANGLEGGDSIVSFFDIAVDYVATGRLSQASSGDGAPPPN